jgi:D-ribose pyranose/furanose isomerase RbsD
MPSRLNPQTLQRRKPTQQANSQNPQLEQIRVSLNQRILQYTHAYVQALNEDRSSLIRVGHMCPFACWTNVINR